PQRAGGDTLCPARRRILLRLQTMRQDRPSDRTTARLCFFDRTPVTRRCLNRLFDRCAFPGFQKPSVSRRATPRRWQPTGTASTSTIRPTGAVWRSRPRRARAEPRRLLSRKQNKRSGARARATLLRAGGHARLIRKAGIQCPISLAEVVISYFGYPVSTPLCVRSPRQSGDCRRPVSEQAF